LRVDLAFLARHACHRPDAPVEFPRIDQERLMLLYEIKKDLVGIDAPDRNRWQLQQREVGTKGHNATAQRPRHDVLTSDLNDSVSPMAPGTKLGQSRSLRCECMRQKRRENGGQGRD
jgi:hypothetical protein